MGEESQKTEHGDATKIEGVSRLIFPIVASDFVMLMIFVGQSQPDIEIGQVNQSASSSSKMRAIS